MEHVLKQNRYSLLSEKRTNLIVIVHASQVSPTLVTSDLYKTLAAQQKQTNNNIITNQTHIVSSTYCPKHDAEHEPAVAPDNHPAGGRVQGKLSQGEQGAHEYR